MARYRADFLPERPLSADDNAIAVYHFDVGSGDVARDSSSNGFDGSVRGARWIVPSEVKAARFVMPSVADTSLPPRYTSPVLADRALKTTDRTFPLWAAWIRVPADVTFMVPEIAIATSR